MLGRRLTPRQVESVAAVAEASYDSNSPCEALLAASLAVHAGTGPAAELCPPWPGPMIDEAEVTDGGDVAGDPPGRVGTLRALLGLAIDSVDAVGDSPARAAWRELERAQLERTPVIGRLLLTLQPGAFLQLGSGLYGFAPRVELPAWVPRQPRSECVGRELECSLIALDAEAGVALLSPRLLALRRAREAIGGGRRLRGSVVSATATGIVVDLDGARGFIPLTELSSEALLVAPEPGSAWWGYAIGMADTGPLLSHHDPAARGTRAQSRERMLAELVPGRVASGRVLRTDAAGALVTFADGVVWGHVPRPALRSPAGRRLARGGRADFRVLGRDPGDPTHLQLWPAP